MKSFESGFLGRRRAHDVERMPHHRLGHRHLPHETLERDQVVAADRPLELRILQRGRGPDDAELLVVRRVVDDDVEHEAIELRFRQRIGAFQLDRVLRREHEERLGQLVGLALHGDPVLLHRLEQRRLRLRRRAVDFVREHDVREDRARREHHLAATGGGVFLHQVGAGDVGRHQVGGELDARELQVEDARHRVNEQRLGQAGSADDQAVAADEQRRQHLRDDLVLTDDDLLQLGDDLLAAGIHAVGKRDVVRRQIDDRRTSVPFGSLIRSCSARCPIAQRSALLCLPPLESLSSSARSRSPASRAPTCTSPASMLSLSSRSDSTRRSRSRRS